jgi:D-glycero-alpha-D-manno-heptose-7-phosphate kinase
VIVARAPLRFSLGGGGTDLPAYASRFGGYVVAAAVDKYVYVCANPRFQPSLRLSYSKTEIVDDVSAIEHPIFREALRLLGIERSLELVSIADLPAQSGLGSSGTFTVALLAALYATRGEFLSARELAERAADIEMNRLAEPVGGQDPYIAAHGGVTAFTFRTDGGVDVERVPVEADVLDELERSLLIVDSGALRPARVVLGEQGERIQALEADVIEGMHRVKEIGHEVRELLVRGDLDRYGELLHEHWTRKRRFASSMTDASIDAAYEDARRAGALGGKLMGAGGGGFFMLYVRPEHRRRVTDAMTARGLAPLRFRFEPSGARIVANVGRG